MFDDVFHKVCDPQFGKDLGGELPLYIQTYPIQQQEEVDKQLEYLEKRLENNNMPAIFIDAYKDICLRILKDRDILGDIMEMEAEHSSDPIDLYDNIAYQMEPDEIKAIVEEKANDNPDAKTIFIVGIDRAFPMLRAHVVLSNLQEMAATHNIILFYPGSYNNQHMSLFDRLPQENYYRAYNLDDIK